MKLAMMAGDVGRLISAAEPRPLGFEAVQMFFGDGPDGDPKDPTPETVDALLQAGDVARRVCLDAANLTPDRTPLARAVRMLGPDTIMMRAKDVRFDPTGLVDEYVPTGIGTLDYPSYLAYLRARSTAPDWVLEYGRNRDDLLRARDMVRHAYR